MEKKDLSYEIYLRQHKDSILPPENTGSQPQSQSQPQQQTKPQAQTPSPSPTKSAPVDIIDISGIKEVLPAGVLYFFASDIRSNKFRFMVADLQRQMWALIFKENSMKAYLHEYKNKRTFWYEDPSIQPENVTIVQWNDFIKRAKEILEKINASHDDSRIIAPQSFLTSQGVPNSPIALGSGILSQPAVISMCSALYPKADLGLAQGMPISLIYSTEPPQ